MESYQQKVQRILKGQLAPLIDGERHILVRCLQCGRIWLKQGGHARLDLEPREILRWAERLGADIADLLTMTCRPCADRYMGGEFELDEYADPGGRIGGYGYSWEAYGPPAHMLAGVLQLAWARNVRPEELYENIVTNPSLARAVLSWLVSSTRHALLYQPFTPEAVAELTRTNPPGAHAPGTEGWVWRGASWQGMCGPLGGIVQVTFAWAGEEAALSALPPALAKWRAVAQRAQQYGIAGEP